MRIIIMSIAMVLSILLVLVGCGRSEQKNIETTSATMDTTPLDAAKETTETTEARETLPPVEFVLPEGEAAEDENSSDEYYAEETRAENKTQSEEERPDDITPSQVVESKPVEQEYTEPLPTESKVPDTAESCGCAYEKYLAMSASEQEAYAESFASLKDFITWSRNAEAEHQGHNTVTNVAGGVLNIGDYIN